MAHKHHHHTDAEAGDTKVALAILVNLGLTVVQIIGGVFSGSLALIADAIHNLSDAVSLIIAYFARKIARRPADEAMTFGYGRAEIVAALINYTSLILIGFYLAYEAVLRFFDPLGVDGWLVVIIAGIALAVDVVTALLTYTLSRESMNIRAAFLHNVADALGSVAVIIAGSLILFFDWNWIDPAITLLIAGYILWMSFGEIGPVIRILMLGSPRDINIAQLVETVLATKGVAGVHNLHIWQMQEHENALQGHLVIEEGQWQNADAVKDRVKTNLGEAFGISHFTLELECHRHACVGSAQIGHHNPPQNKTTQGK